MKTRYAAIFTLIGCCIASNVYAYGEDGSITMEQRALHFLTNAARCDTGAALAKCGKNCLTSESYKSALPPYYWNEHLAKAAHFYAHTLGYSRCLQHKPPCTLKKNLYELSRTCDGSPYCACEEGTIYCGYSFGSEFDKVHAFMKGYDYGSDYTAVSENLVHSSNKKDMPQLLDIMLLEDGNDTYGHRKSILSEEYNVMGAGFFNGTGVQEFAAMNKDVMVSAISSAAAYTDTGTQTFALHYYQPGRSVQKAVLVLGSDDCYELAFTRGSDHNAVFQITEKNIEMPNPQKCTPFYFELRMDDGNVARYPTTGSLLYGNCSASWQNTAAPRCLAGPYVHEKIAAQKKARKYKKETVL